MSDFDSYVDDFIRKMQDESYLEPFFVQLRTAWKHATNAINEDNMQRHGRIVDSILRDLNDFGGLPKPITFTLLMARTAKANTAPSQITALTTQLANSTINKPKVSQEYMAAVGCGVPHGFKPSIGNPFYHPELTLDLAATRLVETFKSRLPEVTHLSSLAKQQEQSSQLRTYVVKIKGRETHPVMQMRKELAFAEEFLRNGRKGWPLINMSPSWFQEAIKIATEFGNLIRALSLLPHCQVFKEGSASADFIRTRLKWLVEVKKTVGRNTQAQQQEAQQMQELENLRLMFESTNLQPGLDEQMGSMALAAPAAKDVMAGKGKGKESVPPKAGATMKKGVAGKGVPGKKDS